MDLLTSKRAYETFMETLEGTTGPPLVNVRSTLLSRRCPVAV
jgi:hypothetical protein